MLISAVYLLLVLLLLSDFISVINLFVVISDGLYVNIIITGYLHTVQDAGIFFLFTRLGIF